MLRLFSRVAAVGALFISVVLAGEVQPTPYDLIRPVWPLSWDSTVFNEFAPGTKKTSIPSVKTPVDYAPNAYIPDTVNQAYLDAMNIRISPIRVNQAGYRPSDEKMFYYIGSSKTFDVVDASGAVVSSGKFEEKAADGISSSISIKASNNAQNVSGGDTRYTTSGKGPSGTVWKGFLPDGLPENQRLRVKVGSDYSATFVVSTDVYSMVRSAALKFFGVNRSGDSESWFHPRSHMLDGSVGGQPGALAGGWYDCGDHLKESQTMSYAMMTLALMAAALEDRDRDDYAYNQSEAINVDGIPDMLREAKHGADFVMKAYEYAKGNVAAMPVSVGDFGKDHGWWGRPEYQDSTIHDRGGPTSRLLRSDNDAGDKQLGSTASGDFAAAMAIVSKLYAIYDQVYADSALKIAKDLYEYGKKVKSLTGSPAYSGGSTYHDEMGTAAICLFYATGDKYYLNDAVENKDLAGGQTKADFVTSDKKGAGMFNGGWFAHKEASFLKSGANTDWASVFTHGLYAFYKLILSTEDKAASYGIDSKQRMIYIEDVALTLAANIGARSGGASSTIPLPVGQASWSGSPSAGFDPLWFSMTTQQTWIYNRYQAGNIFEVLAYADVAKDLENVKMPQLGGVQPWNSEKMFQLGVNQMNYMLGMNPWDISMMIGVGDKNHAHPHHRGANPEGKNVPGAIYKYRTPVGALFGGVPPLSTGESAVSEHFDDYHVTEVCLDASASMLPGSVLLAKSENLNRAPDLTVEIKYVGFDSAIVVVKQSMLGGAAIQFGVDSTKLSQSVEDTSRGIIHSFTLKGLTNGTTYYFTATAKNFRSGNETIKYLVDSTQTPYNFTTLNSPPASADIQNVKVCNVSGDSAEIMWYTPNGEYESTIHWDTELKNWKDMTHHQSGDVAGVPTKFHYMKIGGLKEKTTYYYAVESNGAVKSVDENGQPLRFTTPVTQYKFDVRLYKYEFGGLPFLNINVYNGEEKSYDSLDVRLYMRGTIQDMFDIGIRMDICQAYDEAGFNKPCSKETINELTTGFRATKPMRLDDTYDAATNTYQWYFPVPLGGTVIKSTSRFRVDLGWDRHKIENGIWYSDLMNQVPSKVPGSKAGDWSWDAHSMANGDPVNYSGVPSEDKEFGDSDIPPVNNYVTVYRKGQFVWGYSPSYKEMTTKVANYELELSLNAPFNVSDGTYIQLDQGTSTVHVTGTATVSENGVINAIWVNGKQMDDISNAAIYNSTTGKFDLNIPVKMGIGANKIDVTIFAGPSLDCEACQENGGCAFVNRNYFVQFSKGNRTASSLRIQNEDGSSVTSPAEPGKTQFHILVTDKDNAKAGSVVAYVINPRKLDTLKVTLKEVGSATGEFKTSSLISAVNKDAASTSGNEISFYGGDTLYVRYIDAEDEEDISEQTIFAKPTYPVPQYALALDGNCDGKTDSLRVVFTNDFNEGDSFDTLWVSLRNPVTLEGDSFKVVVTEPVVGKSVVTVALPPRAGLPATSAPVGYISAYMKSKGSSLTQIEKASIRDGIAPTLVGVAILENPPFGKGTREAQDTLKISFSEPVSLASKSSWPLAVVDSLGKAVDATGIKVIGNATTSDNGLSWLYVVEGNTDGAILHDGYTATVKEGFTVSDMALNELDLATCNEPARITETPRPVPITASYIKDRQGDGIADFIYMKFERKLRQKDMLDSFVVEWGDPVVYRHFMPSSWKEELEYGSHTETQVSGEDTVDVTVADTFSVLTIEIPESQRFPYGTTHGKANGYGSVLPRLGPLGGFFDKTYPVADLCPPVIMSARLSSKSVDSLGVKMSEPLDTSETGYYLERRRENVVFQHTAVASRKAGQEWVFFFNGDDPTAVRLGDYIRLVPNDKAKYLDKAKNVPTDSNKWVEIKGAATDKLGFSVIAVKSVSGGTDNSGYGEFMPEDNEVFRLTWVDPDNGSETLLATGGARLKTVAVATNYDSSSYHHVGPTFQIDVVLPTATLTASGNPVWEFALNLDAGLFDNLGQAVMATTYKFDLGSIGGIDKLADDGSMRLRLEWMVPKGQTSPVTAGGRAVGTGAYIGNFDFKAVSTYVSDVAADEDASTGIYKRGDVEKAKDSERVIFGVRR